MCRLWYKPAAVTAIHPERDADVLVVGGGIVGLCCALSLAERGRRVRLLERERLGAGASWGNCGYVSPSHSPPLAQPGMPWLALRSLFRPDAPLRVKPRLDPSFFAWSFAFLGRCNQAAVAQAMAAKAPILNLSRQLLGDLIRRERLACEFEERGLFLVYETAKAMAADQPFDVPIADLGVEVELLDGVEARRREPALREGLAGARFFPVDSHLRPDLLLHEVARLARARGVEIEEGIEVRGFSASGSGIEIDTARGALRARHAVLATGAWSPRFARQLGLRVPIQPGKGYSVTAPRPKAGARIPLLFDERKVAITPWRDTFRVGSTMEFAGYDTSLNRRRLDALWRGARATLIPDAIEPPAGARLTEWCGWRPMTPDDLPMIGPAPRLPGVILATGHNMLGVSMANATGEIVAAMATATPPPLDPGPYRPERF
jgi:D-amino-acid dehydrogenase